MALSKRIAILGSTGSIGINALAVIEHLGPPYCPSALSAHKQGGKLVEQSRRLHPAAVAVSDPDQYPAVRDALAGTSTRVYAGPSGLVEMVSRDDLDIVV